MKMKVKINGMHCTSCEETIKKELEAMGVKVETISYKEGEAVVSCGCPPESCKCGEPIKKAVKRAGYTPEAVTPLE